MSYIVKPGGTTYWTSIGSQAGTIPAGTILDLDNTPKTIKDRTMYKIILPLNFQGKYVELTNLAIYTPPEPPTLPPTPDRAIFEWLNAAGEVIVTENWVKDTSGLWIPEERS